MAIASEVLQRIHVLPEQRRQGRAQGLRCHHAPYLALGQPQGEAGGALLGAYRGDAGAELLGDESRGIEVSPQAPARNSKDGQSSKGVSCGVFSQLTSASGSSAGTPKYQKNSCTSSGVLEQRQVGARRPGQQAPARQPGDGQGRRSGWRAGN